MPGNAATARLASAAGQSPMQMENYNTPAAGFVSSCSISAAITRNATVLAARSLHRPTQGPAAPQSAAAVINRDAIEPLQFDGSLGP